MSNTNAAGVNELSDGGSAGARVGKTSSDKFSVLGKTPAGQQSVGTVVTSVDPTVSGCAFLASVQSIAVYAASQVNRLITAGQNFGFIAE